MKGAKNTDKYVDTCVFYLLMYNIDNKIYVIYSIKSFKEVIMKKIFISHAASDKEIVGELIELLEGMGVASNRIFCSSFEGYGIKLGINWLDAIKQELTDESLVLFVLTTNFYNSHMCQCELGAVWANTLRHIPILVPPLTYKDLEYILRNQQSMVINDENKINSLYEEILEWFDLPTLKINIWKLKSDKFLGNVNAILKKKFVL